MRFADVLRLPDEEQRKLGNKVITPRWWNTEEVRALTKQTWFKKLREDLNKNGKLSVNLGVLKFEIGGSDEPLGEAEVHAAVSQLLASEDTLSPERLLELQEEAVSERLFQRRFVVLEGELALQLTVRRHLDLMFSHVADYLGIDASPREHRRTFSKEELQSLTKTVEPLFNATGGGLHAHSEWYNELGNLERTRFGGNDLVRTLLLGESATEGTIVLWPEAALNWFPPGYFGARVLGWLEHVGDNQLAVRGIALGSVFFFRNRRGSRRALGE